jgi:hypothetical protein
MELMRRVDFVLLAALACLAPAASGQGGVTRVFSCEVDGHTVFGDTLPKECYGRAWVQKINGVVVRREEAQPTPDESARRRELRRQKELADKEAARQKRQDDALLERYPTLADLDERRDREVAEFDDAIAEMRAHEKSLVERRNGFDADVQALGDKPVPADLAKAIAYADEELAQARAATAKKVKERDELRQRFDADRRHYIEIASPERGGQR